MKKVCAGCLVFLLIFLIPIGATVYRVMRDDEVQEALDDLEDITFVTDYYHFPQEYITEYSDGTVYREEFIHSSQPADYFKNPIGCIYYENDQPVGQADFERDQFRNLTLVTTADSVTAYDLTYDDHNRVIQQVTSVNGTETEIQTNRYDTQGFLVESTYFQGDTLLKRIVTDYNDLGHRTKVTYYDASDQVTLYEICEFDQKASIETVYQYDAAGNLLKYQENTYSAYQLVVLEKVFDAAGTPISITTRNILSGSYRYPEGETDPFDGR